jgi:hypothetical protein
MLRMNIAALQFEKPADLPFLRAICWQRADLEGMTVDEMLNRYERGWLYHGVLADLGNEERTFLRQLAAKHGSWLATHV